MIPLVYENWFDEMDEKTQFDFLLRCYSDGGDKFDFIWKRIIELPKRGREMLPEEYRDKDVITVWRAAGESPQFADHAISWTLSEEKAIWFLDEYGNRHARYLLKAEISPNDVIAYDDGRNEAEVLQYMGVRNIEVVRTAKSVPPRGFHSIFEGEVTLDIE